MAKHALLPVPLWLLLLLLGGPAQTNARSWTDIEVTHDDLNRLTDPAGLEYLRLKELQLLDANYTPTDVADAVDRSPSTNAPSPMPSSGPSSLPSQLPSEAPTLLPSQYPSALPSQMPSTSPTVDPFPPVDLPKDPKTGYFNYNDETSEYGPANWGSVRTPSKFYWREFDDNGFGAWKGYLEKRNPSKNICESGKRQSPVDLKESGATCHEFHEIRDRRGDYGKPKTWLVVVLGQTPRESSDSHFVLQPSRTKILKSESK